MTYNWKKISGPKESTITFTNRVGTYLAGLVAGVHVIQLMVTDSKGRVDATEVSITIKGAADQDGWLVKEHYSDGSAGNERLITKEKVLI